VLLQVPITVSSINVSDEFVLTSDKAIFLWIGATANLRGKQKALVLADSLKNKWKGVTITRLEGGETLPEFWALFRGEGPIAASSGADEAVEAGNVKKKQFHVGRRGWGGGKSTPDRRCLGSCERLRSCGIPRKGNRSSSEERCN
jgi:hypothetical protein